MAKMLKISKDQAKHFVVVVVCYRALPKRSRSRQTNQQSIQHVRDIPNLALKKNQKRPTPWKIGRIAKTQKSMRLRRFRSEAPLRNDRGALPR